MNIKESYLVVRKIFGMNLFELYAWRLNHSMKKGLQPLNATKSPVKNTSSKKKIWYLSYAYAKSTKELESYDFAFSPSLGRSAILKRNFFISSAILIFILLGNIPISDAKILGEICLNNTSANLILVFLFIIILYEFITYMYSYSTSEGFKSVKCFKDLALLYNYTNQYNYWNDSEKAQTLRYCENEETFATTWGMWNKYLTKNSPETDKDRIRKGTRFESDQESNKSYSEIEKRTQFHEQTLHDISEKMWSVYLFIWIPEVLIPWLVFLCATYLGLNHFIDFSSLVSK